MKVPVSTALRWLVAFLASLTLLPSPASAQLPTEDHLHITLSAPNTYTLSVATDSLWEYRIEASDDLEFWQPVPLDDAFLPGDGGVHSQRVIVPPGAIQAFFRYRIQERAGGASGNTLTDWDRIYSFNANTILDTDRDGIPDYLETSLATNPYDNLSFPWHVIRADPLDKLAGHPRDGAIVVYLNRPLPASVVTVPANFVRQFSYFQLPGTNLDLLDFATLAPGSALILPGRKAVAFLPSPALAAGSNHTEVNNYKIDFTTAVTGIAQLIPWHSEFSTVDTFDDVGSWVKMVRPGETAIEVAVDFAPVIDWSQPLHPSTVISGNATLVEQVSGTPVAVTVTFDYDTNRMTLPHAAPFQPDTAYTVTLGTGFANLMGKPLLNSFTWSFRTRPLRPVPVAGQGPYVTAVTPGDFATAVDAAQVFLTFSEAMDEATLTASTVHLRAHGASGDLSGLFAYDAGSKTLVFTPDLPLLDATRHELTLDASAILSAAAVPQPLQAPREFVFTTAPGFFQNGSGAGMGGPGSGPGGSSGTPDPEQPPPLVFQLSYGDPEMESRPDAGSSVKLSITLADGSQREQQMPNTTNEYATRLSPEIPDGSTVIVTPQFLKGNDPDYHEELEEVQVEILPLNTPLGASYVVFKQGDTPGATGAPVPGVWDFLGPLNEGPFIAQVLINAKLAVVPRDLFLDKKNVAYNPSTEALGVSNYITTAGLPQDSQFTEGCADPKNFRLQANLIDAAGTGNSVQMKLEVVRPIFAGVQVVPISVLTLNYTLDQKVGNTFRGRFLRLVSDSEDDKASGGSPSTDTNNQTILVKLGDTLKASYDTSPGHTVSQEIQVGRPVSENDNSASHKKHDIREVKVNIVVLKNAAGTGPVVTRAMVNADIETTNERFAQAGIRLNVLNIDMGTGDTGVAYPSGPGVDYSNGFDIYTPNEAPLFSLKDGDNNSIDVFYVEFSGRLARDARAVSYFQNANSTIANAKNSIALSSNRNPYTMAHEMMHILLNAYHRGSPQNPGPADPISALFFPITSETKEVDGTKRIGPYPGYAGVENNDATAIRNTSESLP